MKPRLIDVGTVNGYAFFNVASIGLSSELAQGLDPELKKRFGRLGYALAALKVLWKASRFKATIKEKGRVTTVETYQIAVGNGRLYGGGNVVEENAEIDDGHLDLYSLEMKNLWKLALMLRSFRSGTHGAWREVRTARCIEFDIDPEKAMSVNTDGEIVTATPAHFKVHPHGDMRPRANIWRIRAAVPLANVSSIEREVSWANIEPTCHRQPASSPVGSVGRSSTYSKTSST